MSRFTFFLICACLILPVIQNGHVTVRSKCNRFWKRVTGHMSQSVLPNRTISFNGLPPCDSCLFTYPIGSIYTPVGDYHLIQHYRSKCPIVHENHMTFRTSYVSLTCVCNMSSPEREPLVHTSVMIGDINNLTKIKSEEEEPRQSEDIMKKKLLVCMEDIRPLPYCLSKYGSVDLHVTNLTTAIKSVHREGQDVDTIQMTAQTEHLETAKITAKYNGLVMKALQYCFEQIEGYYEFLIDSAVHSFFASESRNDSYTITELDKNLTCTLY